MGGKLLRTCGGLVVLAGLLDLGLQESALAQTLPYLSPLHVNPQTGLDTNPGTLSLPFASVNAALQRVWDVQSQGLGVIDTIKVYASAVPVAPAGFGSLANQGKEVHAWKKNPSDPDLPPFPIRMIDGVDLVGIAVGSVKPRILIDEQGQGTNAHYTNWDGYPFTYGAEAGTQDPIWCTVRGAANCKLDGFDVDGSLLNDKNLSWWPGVYAAGVSGFQVTNCDVHHWHDEVYLAAKAGTTLRGSVSHCTLRYAWPITDDISTPIDDTNFGHAAAWVTGNGALTVTMIEDTFSVCHDGIEVDANSTGHIELTMSVCRFETSLWGTQQRGVENALEIVDRGTVTYSVDNSVFLECHNIPPPNGGTYYPGLGPDDPAVPGGGGSTGALVDRTSGVATGTVRICDFRNFAWGITTGANTSLDMGTSASLGKNNFCLNFADFPPDQQGNATNPFRVALFDRSPNGVTAIGNFWLRGNQSANAFGFMTITSASGAAINLPNTTGIGGTVAVPGPPGPLWLEFPTGSATPYDRNFSIQAPPASSGAITFGTSDPGTAPNCAVTP